MLKQFNEISPGMEKDDVLDLMGSPNQAQRFHGKDKWTYVFYDKRIRFEKEIQFFEGNAIYVGEITQPPVEQSAIAVDARNESTNKALNEMMMKETTANRKAYDAYEAQTRGEDKVRYIPQFEPLQ
jgi:outer membrane protein assembly factor BamE